MLFLTGFALLLAAPPRSWDFSGDASDWLAPEGLGGVIDSDGNRVYAITTDRPHHTRMLLEGTEDTPDFVASARFRVVDHSGEPPAVYLYGRWSGDGFRFLSVRGGELSASAWYGADQPPVRFGATQVAGAPTPGVWIHARLACYGDRLWAKAWADGTREPRWQIDGAAPEQPRGAFALGVWTSPRTPSRATVWFDDITFQPIDAADLPVLGLTVERRRLYDGPLPERGVFEHGDLIGAATPALAVLFDRTTGQVAHLLDRLTGTDLAALDVAADLFELTLSRPARGEEQSFGAGDFATVAARTVGSHVELSFSGAPESLEASATVMPDGDRLRWRLNIDNRSEWAVKEIRYPVIPLRPNLGEGDHVVVPWCAGALVPQPGDRTIRSSGLYPGSAAYQFVARYGGSGGLYLATEDAGGECKRWELQTSAGRQVTISVTHLRPEQLEPRLELPYDTVLAAFRGDWRDAADIYRRWAESQPWCRTRLADRDDIPSFLKEGAGVLITGIANPQARAARYGERLERLPAELAAYRERTGLAHLVFVPYGWEHRGTWAGIHYLPAQPSNEVWREVNQTLAAQGDRTAFLTSGYWWVVKRRATNDGPEFDDSADFAAREELVVHDADGKPFLVDAYDSPGGGQGWRGLSATLCHGSAAASQTLLETFLGIAGLGVSLISFDQEIGGGQHAPCYDPRHGHPPGYGSWMWTSFRDLCSRILAEGKPIQPELGLLLENVSELAIPYMATYWSRQFSEVDYGLAGARTVGVFAYPYHDYITMIGAALVQGQGAMGTRPDALLRCRVLANCLTRGLLPGPFLHDVPLDPADDWHRQVTAAYLSYCRPYAKFPEYLVLGRACRPLATTCDEVTAGFYRQSPDGEPLRPGGPKVVRTEVRLPAIAVGSFAASDGSVATVLANITPETRTAECALTGPSTVFTADRVEEQRVEGRTVRLALEPFGVRVVVGR